MPALLTAQNCSGNVHLVVGSGALAASRCTKSLQAGAQPILVAPEYDNIHFTLAKQIEDGVVQWTRREFEDQDLTSLGREEVDHVVDAVFVTTGPRHPISLRISNMCKRFVAPLARH